MASRFFIRSRGRKVGPLTIDKIHALARRGRFGRHFEVSTNGKSWKRATEFPELFPDDSGDDDDEYGGGPNEFGEDEDGGDDDEDSSTEQSEKRSRRSRRSSRPAASGYPDPSDEPSPPPRRRRAGRSSIPLAGGPDPVSSGPAPTLPVGESGGPAVPIIYDTPVLSGPLGSSDGMDDGPLVINTGGGNIDAPIVGGGGGVAAGGGAVTAGGGAVTAGGGSVVAGGGGGHVSGQVSGNVGGMVHGTMHVVGDAAGQQHNNSGFDANDPNDPNNLYVDDEEEKPRRRGRRGRRGKKEEEKTPAVEAAFTLPEGDADIIRQASEEDEPPKKKRFFGLFGGGDPKEDMPEYLQKLHRISAKLKSLDFDVDDLVFIGNGRDELAATGHGATGSGIETLGMLTMIAFQARGTDLHFEPREDGYDARLRMDGILVQIVHLPPEAGSKVYGVVKVLCEIAYTGKHSIQEGSYSSTAPGRRTDYRISFTPAHHGQKLAIRVLDLSNSPQSSEQLGAPKKLMARLKKVMDQNAGMILLCGPTGSGKTTTLYSLIRGINVRQRNVMTLEDPVEYQIPGVTQSSVDESQGKGFANMLRALLRQDPDVILLGEIRDGDSARIAMQATMTGHLVLSTVHAQDTLNTVFRLLDLGADPNMVCSALDVVLGQRLVRVLCQNCCKRRKPSDKERKRMGRFATKLIYDPKGCARCLGTGYAGRRAMFEMLVTTDRLKEVMMNSPSLAQLKQAVGPNFVTLRAHGYQMAGEGITSLAEVDRVLGAH